MLLKPLGGHLPKLIHVAGAAAAFVRAAIASPAALGSSCQLLEPAADVQCVQGVHSSLVLGGVCRLWEELPAEGRLHVTMQLVIAKACLPSLQIEDEGDGATCQDAAACLVCTLHQGCPLPWTWRWGEPALNSPEEGQQFSC